MYREKIVRKKAEKGITLLKKKKLFLFVGRTASGKSSIARAVCDIFDLKQVKSYTTRPMRPKEKENPNQCDHYFITDNEVPKYSNDMVAYTEINGYKYFTTKEVLLNSDIYVIDPVGIDYLKLHTNPNEFEFITVYFRVPKPVAKYRAKERGEDLEVFESRYESEDKQFKDFENHMAWDYHILNDHDFGNAVRQVEKIIKKELIL